mmetsp:Transcript_50782/g.146507  ORF Transcript_50782/g.146507 Transcript_50782/m.146507 type:complete len:358 (-) Transcript_50782:1057-2130(-)
MERRSRNAILGLGACSGEPFAGLGLVPRGDCRRAAGCRSAMGRCLPAVLPGTRRHTWRASAAERPTSRADTVVALGAGEADRWRLRGQGRWLTGRRRADDLFAAAGAAPPGAADTVRSERFLAFLGRSEIPPGRARQLCRSLAVDGLREQRRLPIESAVRALRLALAELRRAELSHSEPHRIGAVVEVLSQGGAALHVATARCRAGRREDYSERPEATGQSERGRPGCAGTVPIAAGHSPRVLAGHAGGVRVRRGRGRRGLARDEDHRRQHPGDLRRPRGGRASCARPAGGHRSARGSLGCELRVADARATRTGAAVVAACCPGPRSRGAAGQWRRGQPLASAEGGARRRELLWHAG